MKSATRLLRRSYPATKVPDSAHMVVEQTGHEGFIFFAGLYVRVSMGMMSRLKRQPAP